MLISRFFFGMFSLGLMFLGTGMVSAQDFPNKPLRVVTSLAGDSNDLLARIIAQGISVPLGQPVIVDNRGGTGSVETVAKAPPDGYTLVLYGSAIWLAPFLRSNVQWDVTRDFSPVTLAESSPNALVVHPSVAAKSVKELIALAKARPGELNYSSGPAGGTSHLTGELFKSLAGVNIVRIPYKSGGTALNGLLGGEVQLTFAGAGTLNPHIKSGKLRAVAVTSAEPSALFPGVPTVAATVPGYEAASLTVILAPAKTPVAVINRLNREIVKVLLRADVKERLFSAGEQVVGSSPRELTATINAEIARWSKLIKDTGIKAN